MVAKGKNAFSLKSNLTSQKKGWFFYCQFMKHLVNKMITLTDLKGLIGRYFAFKLLVSITFFGAVLVPMLTHWGGLSLVQVQFLQSWFMFWIFVLEVPTGAVADFFGRKYSIALGAMVMAVACIVYGLVPKFEVFLLAEFLFAGAVALMSGADNALLYDALKEKGEEGKSKAVFARAHSLHLIGIAVAGPIGSFIAFELGLQWPMILSAIPVFLAALVAWSLPEPKLKERIPERKRYLLIAKNGITFFLRHKKLRHLAADSILVASVGYFVLWLNQPLLEQAGVSIFIFGYFTVILIVSEVLVSANFTLLEKLVGGIKNYLRISAAITAAGFLLVALYPHPVTIILFLILSGGFGLTRMELMNSYMNDLIPSEQRATVLSAISMFRRVALVFLNPLVGLMADRSLVIPLVFLALLALGVFFFSHWDEEKVTT